MRKFKLFMLFFISIFFLIRTAFASLPIQIVAAENFYGQIAQQLGGEYVQVVSILNHPNQDPHLFSSSPSTAIAIANAQMIIYNGLGYDAWIEKLILNPNKKVINVSELMHKKSGANPHIWYQVDTMLVYATYLTSQLIAMDPPHSDFYRQQLFYFQTHYTEFTNKINLLKKRYQGMPIIATEPVFNYLAQALGFKIYAEQFQLSIMNETEPTVTQIKDFEQLLRQHKVKLLVYNSQVSNPLTLRMQKLAQQQGIVIFGVTETQPPKQSYLDWMIGELKRLEASLR